jgi:DnaK suppressor protein
MRREDNGRPAARWRAVLEARWRIRLEDLTELSMAYHAATSGEVEDTRSRRLLRRAVAARQRLADTEDALSRVTAGVFGQCEQCGAAVPEGLLAAAPETRYCIRCADTDTVTTTGALTTGRLTTDSLTPAGLTTRTLNAAAGHR